MYGSSSARTSEPAHIMFLLLHTGKGSSYINSGWPAPRSDSVSRPRVYDIQKPVILSSGLGRLGSHQTLTAVSLVAAAFNLPSPWRVFLYPRVSIEEPHTI